MFVSGQAVLTAWQNAIYYQLKARSQTIAQLMSANALGQDQVEKVLGELAAPGLAREGSGGWELVPCSR